MQRTTPKHSSSNLFDCSNEADSRIHPFVRSPIQEAEYTHNRKHSKASSYAASKKKLSEIHTDLVQLQSKFSKFQNNLRFMNSSADHKVRPHNGSAKIPQIQVLRDKNQRQGQETKKIIINNKTYTCRNFPASYFENVDSLFQDKRRRQRSGRQIKGIRRKNANKENQIGERKAMNNVKNSKQENKIKLNIATPYADTQGILKASSNFTVKTVKTYRNANRSVGKQKQEFIEKQRKDKQKKKQGDANEMTQRNSKYHILGDRNKKQKLMFLTPHDSKHISGCRQQSEQICKVQNSRVSREQQLQACIRLMNNQNRVNRYCDCCSNGQSRVTSHYEQNKKEYYSVSGPKNRNTRTAEPRKRAFNNTSNQSKSIMERDSFDSNDNIKISNIGGSFEGEELDQYDLDGVLAHNSFYQSYHANNSLLQNFSVQTKKKNPFQIYSSRTKMGTCNIHPQIKNNSEFQQCGDRNNFIKTFNNSAVGRCRKVMNRTQMSGSKLQRSSTAVPKRSKHANQLQQINKIYEKEEAISQILQKNQLSVVHKENSPKQVSVAQEKTVRSKDKQKKCIELEKAGNKCDIQSGNKICNEDNKKRMLVFDSADELQVQKSILKQENQTSKNECLGEQNVDNMNNSEYKVEQQRKNEGQSYGKAIKMDCKKQLRVENKMKQRDMKVQKVICIPLSTRNFRKMGFANQMSISIPHNRKPQIKLSSSKKISTKLSVLKDQSIKLSNTKDQSLKKRQSSHQSLIQSKQKFNSSQKKAKKQVKNDNTKGKGKQQGKIVAIDHQQTDKKQGKQNKKQSVVQMKGEEQRKKQLQIQEPSVHNMKTESEEMESEINIITKTQKIIVQSPCQQNNQDEPKDKEEQNCGALMIPDDKISNSLQNIAPICKQNDQILVKDEQQNHEKPAQIYEIKKIEQKYEKQQEFQFPSIVIHKILSKKESSQTITAKSEEQNKNSVSNSLTLIKNDSDISKDSLAMIRKQIQEGICINQSSESIEQGDSQQNSENLSDSPSECNQGSSKIMIFVDNPLPQFYVEQQNNVILEHNKQASGSDDNDRQSESIKGDRKISIKVQDEKPNNQINTVHLNNKKQSNSVVPDKKSLTITQRHQQEQLQTEEKPKKQRKKSCILDDDYGHAVCEKQEEREDMEKMINFTDSQVMMKLPSEHGSVMSSQVDYCQLGEQDQIKEADDDVSKVETFKKLDYLDFLTQKKQVDWKNKEKQNQFESKNDAQNLDVGSDVKDDGYEEDILKDINHSRIQLGEKQKQQQPNHGQQDEEKQKYGEKEQQNSNLMNLLILRPQNGIIQTEQGLKSFEGGNAKDDGEGQLVENEMEQKQIKNEEKMGEIKQKNQEQKGEIKINNVVGVEQGIGQDGEQKNTVIRADGWAKEQGISQNIQKKEQVGLQSDQPMDGNGPSFGHNLQSGISHQQSAQQSLQKSEIQQKSQLQSLQKGQPQSLQKGQPQSLQKGQPQSLQKRQKSQAQSSLKGQCQSLQRDQVQKINQERGQKKEQQEEEQRDEKKDDNVESQIPACYENESQLFIFLKQEYPSSHSHTIDKQEITKNVTTSIGVQCVQILTLNDEQLVNNPVIIHQNPTSQAQNSQVSAKSQLIGSPINQPMKVQNIKEQPMKKQHIKEQPMKEQHIKEKGVKEQDNKQSVVQVGLKKGRHTENGFFKVFDLSISHNKETRDEAEIVKYIVKGDKNITCIPVSCLQIDIQKQKVFDRVQAIFSIIAQGQFINRLFSHHSSTCWLFHNFHFHPIQNNLTSTISHSQIIKHCLTYLYSKSPLNCKDILQILTAVPILSLKNKNWNKLRKLHQHPNIVGIAINHTQHNVHSIIGTKEISRKGNQEMGSSTTGILKNKKNQKRRDSKSSYFRGEEQATRIVSLKNQKGIQFNIKWQKFLQDYDQAFLTCLHPKYHLRSYEICEPPNQLNRCFVVEMDVKKSLSAFNNTFPSKKQIHAQKTHCVLGIQGKSMVSGNIMVYGEFETNKYEYVGCGQMNFISMRVSARKYVLVIQKCEGGQLLVTCSSVFELKRGSWAADLQSALSCDKEELVKCSSIA